METSTGRTFNLLHVREYIENTQNIKYLIGAKNVLPDRKKNYLMCITTAKKTQKQNKTSCILAN